MPSGRCRRHRDSPGRVPEAGPSQRACAGPAGSGSVARVSPARLRRGRTPGVGSIGQVAEVHGPLAGSGSPFAWIGHRSPAHPPVRLVQSAGGAWPPPPTRVAGARHGSYAARARFGRRRRASVLDPRLPGALRLLGPVRTLPNTSVAGTCPDWPACPGDQGGRVRTGRPVPGTRVVVSGLAGLSRGPGWSCPDWPARPGDQGGRVRTAGPSRGPGWSCPDWPARPGALPAATPECWRTACVRGARAREGWLRRTKPSIGSFA